MGNFNATNVHRRHHVRPTQLRCVHTKMTHIRHRHYFIINFQLHQEREIKHLHANYVYTDPKSIFHGQLYHWIDEQNCLCA